MKNYSSGQQPCKNFEPQIDGNEYGTWNNEHECVHCREKTSTVSFCLNCFTDHHFGGYETCERTPTLKSKFVYQLVAEGSSAIFDGIHQLRNTIVFTSKEEAEKRFSKFKQFVTNKDIFHPLEDNDYLKIRIIPLEVVEDKS